MNIMRTIKSSRSCGDKLFEELDYYYKQDGKIDRVIGNDLIKLYNRADFLKRGYDI